MNIIFLDWPCFCREDTVAALTGLGHSVSFFSTGSMIHENQQYLMLLSMNFTIRALMTLCFPIIIIRLFQRAAKGMVSHIFPLYMTPRMFLYTPIQS